MIPIQFKYWALVITLGWVVLRILGVVHTPWWQVFSLPICYGGFVLFMFAFRYFSDR